MLKTLSDLLRGTVADQAQAIHDANAVVLLRQQIRDAPGRWRWRGASWPSPWPTKRARPAPWRP